MKMLNQVLVLCMNSESTTAPKLKSFHGYFSYCFYNVLLFNIISFAEYGNRESTVFHSFLGLQQLKMESNSADLCDSKYPISLSGRQLITFPRFFFSGEKILVIILGCFQI